MELGGLDKKIECGNSTPEIITMPKLGGGLKSLPYSGEDSHFD